MTVILLAALSLVAPKNDSTVPLLSERQRAYLDMSREERRTLFVDEARRKELKNATGDRPLPVRLQWSGADGKAMVMVSLDGRQVFATNVTENAVSVWNLEIARRYEWSVTCSGETAKGSFRTEDRAPRILYIPGIPNVRDLGGRAGLGGRRVRQGLVYRTAGLNDNATSKYYRLADIKKFWEEGGEAKVREELGKCVQVEGGDLESVIRHLKKGDCSEKSHVNRYFVLPGTMKPGKERLTPATRSYMTDTLGIRSDIDLRTSVRECYGMTGSPLGSKATWFNYPSSAYGGMQGKSGKAAFTKVFKVFLDRANYPIAFHCIAGQDRTGSVAFILNGLLGVAEEELYLDWEVTAFWNPSVTLNHKDRFDKLVEGFEKNFQGATLNDKIVAYVLSLGFTMEDIERFRGIMLESK